MRRTLFLFGEAEKGEFGRPIYCKTLPQTLEALGNPPGESRGVHLAVQTLLYEREVIFFRVKEEGFSKEDYMRGLKLIQTKEVFSSMSALCMPGVGDSEIIDATYPVCNLYKIFLIVDEKDLYDYLTYKAH